MTLITHCTNKQLLIDWLLDHKTSTLPAWLIRNPTVLEWVNGKTAQYDVKNVMQRVHIILNGPPELCSQGNPKRFKTYDLGYYNTCATANKCECVGILRKKNLEITLLAKYGTAKYSEIPGIAEKRKATTLERFGTEYAGQSKEIKEKCKANLLARTPEQVASITATKTAKYQATSMSKFSQTHHMKCADQQAKVIATNLERYQVEHVMQNDIIAAAAKETWKNKTSEEMNLKSLKTQKTMTERYHVSYASQIPVSKNTLEILQDPIKFTACITGKTRYDVMHELSIAPSTLFKCASKYQVLDLFAPTPRLPFSKFEIGVADFVTSLGVVIETNNRSIIKPKELDIWIPSLNIAIECSGVYWHSELSSGKSKNYHWDKMQKCREQGITLITIFDDEWSDKQDAVKLRLAHILSNTTTGVKVGARSCTVNNCDPVDAKQFVNDHHLQGHVTASVNLSLVYKDQIVAVMTLGQPRYNKDHAWEILRFCTNGSVPGAASKLFKYFVRVHNPLSVISYSDNRWGQGRVYESMNFVRAKETIGYFYTNYKSRFNRTQFQKHKLVAAGANPLMTEWQIMQEHGYDRIWDCGQVQWLWTCK